MEAEKLKVIAKGVGYKSYLGNFEGEYVGIETVRTFPDGETYSEHELYNPLTNNDQMVEIMEKLKLHLTPLKNKWAAKTYHENTTINIYATGETINEAVCNAAYQYFKQP